MLPESSVTKKDITAPESIVKCKQNATYRMLPVPNVTYLIQSPHLEKTHNVPSMKPRIIGHPKLLLMNSQHQQNRRYQ